MKILEVVEIEVNMYLFKGRKNVNEYMCKAGIDLLT